MNEMLWAAIGLTIGAAILHGAIGLRRPRDRTYLSFACLMALLAVYVFFQREIYEATTVRAAVEASRWQHFVISGFVACMLVFIPAYTKARIPRPVLAIYYLGLVVLIAVNALAPYSVWYSGEPVLVSEVFHGARYSSVIPPPMGLTQYAYSLYLVTLLLIAIGCGLRMVQRGDRRRGWTFAITAALILVHSVVDVVRDNIGGAWPYVTEYGLVTWGIIMSVQLARDFRAQAVALAHAIVHVEDQARRLTAILESLRTLEQKVPGPLHTLETGIAALGAGGAVEHDAQLRRLERAVTRLREFVRSIPGLGPALGEWGGSSGSAHPATRAK